MIIRNVIIFLLVIFSQNLKSQCDRISDSLALVEFYINTDGPNWKDNTNWLIPGKPINTWKGVLVNLNDCVWFLSLSSNNLKGTLEYGLDKLTGLEYLNLFDNELFGEIPKSIMKLPELTSLILSRNTFSGQIPSEIKFLTQLENLSLDDNLFSGPIPVNLYELSNLKSLSLSRNTFTGNLSNNISGLKNLEFLDLGYNNFIGGIPENLGTLLNLKSLELSNNSFSGIIPPGIRFLINLEDLWLSSNRFNGDINSFLGDFNNLKVLNLANNDFSEEINIDFGKYPQMEYLNLSRNNFKGQLPKKINSLTKIIRPIDFSDNQFESPIPDDLIQSKRIFIGNNNFTFKDILRFDSLNPGSAFFYYSPQNQFYKDTVLNAIAGQDFLIDLEIDSLIPDNEYKWRKNGNQNWVPNDINDPNSNKLIFPNVSLADVATYDTRVTNANFSSVVRLQSHNIGLRVCNRLNDSLELVKLFNSTSGITWNNNTNWLKMNFPIDTWYGIKVDEKGCVNKINLSNNNLQNELPSLDLNTLDTLILKSNNLNGGIPVLKIPFIKYLDLSNNGFNGNIPSVLTTWMKLVNLNLSYNNLSGIIPPDIGDLCDLEELKLDNNNFNDELPEELTYLQNLKIGMVDFSNNEIDSIKQKIAFFCPYGDNILSSNPSYDRFLGICNIACTGIELDSINSYKWINDSLISLETKYCNSELCRVDFGYTVVRNVQVLYSRILCFDSSTSNDYIETTSFYDCGGNILEEIILNSNGDYISSGTILKDEYILATFESHWSCGYTLNSPTYTNDFFNLSNIKNSLLICYPNPSSNGEIKFRYKDGMNVNTLQIFDINGNIVNYRISLEKNEFSIITDSSNLGFYIIKIKGQNNVFVGKVLLLASPH